MFFQTELKQSDFEPNPSFFSNTEPKPNWNKKSIPHIPKNDVYLHLYGSMVIYSMSKKKLQPYAW